MNQSLVSFFFLIVFQNGVVHRDLKLENVLLDENCNIKVSFAPWFVLQGYKTWIQMIFLINAKLQQIVDQSVSWS